MANDLPHYGISTREYKRSVKVADKVGKASLRGVFDFVDKGSSCHPREKFEILLSRPYWKTMWCFEASAYNVKERCQEQSQ